MSTNATVLSKSVEETERIGMVFADTLQGGDLVALTGALGSGKTAFVRGVARGQGVCEDDLVTSPTFVLLRTYRGRLIMHHIDAYRITDRKELESIGLDELCGEADAVVLVEWADRAPGLSDGMNYHVGLEHAGGDERRITIGPAVEGLLKRLRAHGLEAETGATGASP